MRKIKWFQDPNQFYAIYNQLMSSRPKLALSAHLFYSLPLEDTVYESVCGQVPGLSGIIERGKAESPHFENIMRDLFQSLYSLQAVCRPAEDLSLIHILYLKLLHISQWSLVLRLRLDILNSE